MAQKELTERESKRNLTLSTLEQKLIQNVYASHVAESDPYEYGRKGMTAAQNFYNSKEFSEEKQNQFEDTKKKYQSAGINDEPSYPTKGDIKYKVVTGLEHVMQDSYLGDLADGVKKVTKLAYEIPEELKDYLISDLLEKAAEEKKGQIVINPNKLDDKEKIAFDFYQNLRETYKEALILRMYGGDLAALNEHGKEI